MPKQMLELYVHIPFCVRKCGYCDFYSGAFSKTAEKRYFEELQAEILGAKARISPEYEVTSVFFGGGTPSIPDASEVISILALLKECFVFSADAEISLEANPGTLTKEKLAAYKAGGINRLSIGLQSAVNEELKVLGRIHTYEDFLNSYENAREAGFSNINIDLMSGIPLQTAASFRKTLENVIALTPEHISAYSLILEENTPFFERFEETDEELDRTLYHLTKDMLSEAGYRRYEISNYAKAGFECRHNIGYWTGVSYLGFGAAAASCFEHRRYKNASSLDYRRLPLEEVEELSAEEEMGECMILGLRLTDGVDDAVFKKRFGVSLFECYAPEIRKYTDFGCLKRSGSRIMLTDYGFDVSNEVMQAFL